MPVDVHHDLNDAQVEALVTAIEATPIGSGGTTDDVTDAAALYLVEDDPATHERQLLAEIASVDDQNALRTHLSAFATISKRFDDDTINITSPQIAQTRTRLARVVGLLRDALGMQGGDVRKPAATLAAVRSEAPAPTVEVEQPSIWNSNWFRFLAFAVAAILLLLVVVFVVQWLRRSNVAADQQQQQRSEQVKGLL